MRKGHPAVLPLLCVLVIGIGATFPATAGAQESAVETLVEGRRSIQLGGISGGASLGFWKMRDDRTNVGWILNGSIGFRRSAREGSNTVTNTDLSLGFGPEIRRYTSIAGRVAPYGFVGGRLGFAWERTDVEVDSNSSWMAMLDARVGVGAEFFPVPNLSLGGQMGVSGMIGYRPFDDPDGSTFQARVGTFGASIMAAIYY